MSPEFRHDLRELEIGTIVLGLPANTIFFLFELSEVKAIFIFVFLKAATLRPYLNAVRATLQAALCLENFSSQVVERHNKPEVEVRYVLSFGAHSSDN